MWGIDFQGQKVAEYRFKAVGEAYGILKDEAKKRRYDRGVPKHKCDDADSDYGYGSIYEKDGRLMCKNLSERFRMNFFVS